tara:strand:+ start:671 stop:838 length:168 start_codon:yes stop_codon:yes gene_type:complete
MLFEVFIRRSNFLVRKKKAQTQLKLYTPVLIEKERDGVIVLFGAIYLRFNPCMPY